MSIKGKNLMTPYVLRTGRIDSRLEYELATDNGDWEVFVCLKTRKAANELVGVTVRPDPDHTLSCCFTGPQSRAEAEDYIEHLMRISEGMK